MDRDRSNSFVSVSISPIHWNLHDFQGGRPILGRSVDDFRGGHLSAVDSCKSTPVFASSIWSPQASPAKSVRFFAVLFLGEFLGISSIQFLHIYFHFISPISVVFIPLFVFPFSSVSSLVILQTDWGSPGPSTRSLPAFSSPVASTARSPTTMSTSGYNTPGKVLSLPAM
jgi:hypothetical protein